MCDVPKLLEQKDMHEFHQVSPVALAQANQALSAACGPSRGPDAAHSPLPDAAHCSHPRPPPGQELQVTTLPFSSGCFLWPLAHRQSLLGV